MHENNESVFEKLVDILDNNFGYTSEEKAEDVAERLIRAGLIRVKETQKWIPIAERLPEKPGHYLVHIECKCDGELWSKWIQVAWFCKKFYWEHSYGAEFFEETITHWMQLIWPTEEDHDA